MKGFQRTFSDILLLVVFLILTALLFTIYTSTKSVPLRPVPYDFEESYTVEPVFNKVFVNKSQFDLRIIVITYNRAASLLRLLKSINNAEYYSDKIKLEVWVDISKEGKKDNATINTAYEFEFKHGSYDVHVREKHAGIYGQWLTSWKPVKQSAEVSVILEDDLTVSPYFYKYLKLVHRKYDSHPEINGYALQGVSIKHHVHDMSTLEGPPGSLVFLYPVLGTWGFSPVTDKWIGFLDWFYSLRNMSDVNPDIPNNIASEWYNMFLKEGKADTMWEIWHIYHAWQNNLYTLYSNFPGHAGLSNSHREAGLHYGSSAGASNKLLEEWKREYDYLPDWPHHLDISGKLS